MPGQGTFSERHSRRRFGGAVVTSSPEHRPKTRGATGSASLPPFGGHTLGPGSDANEKLDQGCSGSHLAVGTVREDLKRVTEGNGAPITAWEGADEAKPAGVKGMFTQGKTLPQTQPLRRQRPAAVRSQPGQTVCKTLFQKSPTQEQSWWSGSRCRPRVQTPVPPHHQKKKITDPKQGPNHRGGRDNGVAETP
jgi:hypothetical protein